VQPTTLRFFSELFEPALAETFSASTRSQLRALGAGVTIGLLDHSEARARVIRQLTDEAIPVGAWLLLPRSDGYFATHDNFARVEALIDDTLRWAEREHLRFEGLGLDFEPHLDELEAFMARPLPTTTKWSWRARDATRWQTALAAYQRIVTRVRSAGLRVESYQFPLVLADRHACGSLWQRIAGGLDVSVEREVVMLYTSLLGVAGQGLISQLAPRCAALGLGSTGGGIDPFPKLSWAELERDLLLAAEHCTDLSIFSLEGCVWHGFLDKLRDFDWERRAAPSLSARLSSQLITAVCIGLSGVTRGQAQLKVETDQREFRR